MGKVKIEFLKLLFVVLFLAAAAPAHEVRADINQINDSTYLMGINNVLLVDTNDMFYSDSQDKWTRVKYTYQSSDPTIAVVKGEILRTKKEGKATITQYANGKYYKKFIVNVTAFDYSYNGKTLILNGYSSKVKLPSKLVIPETVSGIKVTEIGSHAFENAKVDTVVIGANITKIGESAFEQSTARKITVTGAVTLGNYAFISCKQLSELELLGKVRVGANFVAGCPKLKTLTFQGDAIIGFNGLHYAEATEITFQGKAVLEPEAMIECEGIKRINFQGNAELGLRAITDTSVEQITFLGSAKLGIEAISMCESLKEVTFGKDAVLSKEAISLADELKQITFEGETKLKAGAISSSGLETVTFGGKSYLGKGAFTTCTNLQTLSFQSYVEFEKYAFDGCLQIKDILCDESKTILHGNPFYTYFDAETDPIILRLAYRHNQKIWLYNEDTQKAYAKILECMSLVSASDSEVEKLRKVHDWIAESIEYDHSETHYSVMDALLLGKSICGGYSRTLEMFLEFLDMPNAYIISPPMVHAWNQVLLDGNWYNIDVTWDDPTGHPIHHKYFLKSDAAISDHTGYETMGCTSTLYDNIK